jgi:hypothetical protein
MSDPKFGTTEEKRLREAALTDLRIEAGAALHDCQTFEFGLALLLHHYARLGTPGLDANVTAKILDGDAKRTAGQLVAMMRDRLKTSDGLETALTAALRARNTIIHRFLIDNSERIMDAMTRTDVVKELGQLRSTVQKGDRAIRPFVEGLSAALDNLDLEAERSEWLTRFYGMENDSAGAT